MTIIVNKPPSPPSGVAFRLGGSFYPPYAKVPTLSYADDPHPSKVSGVTGTSPKPGTISCKWSPPTTGIAYSPLPFGATVTRVGFHFRHPGLSPGHHTVVVTDGKAVGSVGFGVSNSAHVRLNPFRE